MSIYSFENEPPRVAYLDPSFIVNLLLEDGKYHRACLQYSEKLKRSSITLILSNLGLDEIWFALLKVLAVQDLQEQDVADPERKWFRFLKDHPDRVKAFAQRIEEDTALILKIPNLIVIEITEEQTLKALATMREYGLLPRDAIHATAAMLTGADTIITTDYDFCLIDRIDVYTCNEKALARARRDR